MIPDFPSQKARLWEYWQNYLRQSLNKHLGYFSEIPQYRNHEGDQWRICREDGTESLQAYDEAISVMKLDLLEIPNLTPQQIALRLDETAKEIAGEVIGGVLRRIQQSVDESGRTIDAGDHNLTMDSFLDAANSVQWSFDDEGTPNPPAVILHPKALEAIKDDLRTWEKDPAYLERYAQIVERKREEWRDRESRRKLVD